MKIETKSKNANQMEPEHQIETKSKPGGSRQGAGRKPIWNDTQRKTINVPKALAQRVLDIAHALDEGKSVHLIDESGRIQQIRKVLQAERERMEAAARERKLKPYQMPTWKNVNQLLQTLEQILNH